MPQGPGLISFTYAMKFLPTEEYCITVCRFSSRELNFRTMLRRTKSFKKKKKSILCMQVERNGSRRSVNFFWRFYRFAHKAPSSISTGKRRIETQLKLAPQTSFCFIQWINTIVAKVLVWTAVMLCPAGDLSCVRRWELSLISWPASFEPLCKKTLPIIPSLAQLYAEFFW